MYMGIKGLYGKCATCTYLQKSIYIYVCVCVCVQGIKGLYGGMVPILCKQIPFTITQFLMYEFAAKAIYKKLAASGMCVCIFMCVCVCIYIYIMCVCNCVCVCKNGCMCVRVLMYEFAAKAIYKKLAASGMRAYMCICMCVYICSYIYLLCVCVCYYVCVCKNECVCVRVLMYEFATKAIYKKLAALGMFVHTCIYICIYIYIYIYIYI